MTAGEPDHEPTGFLYPFIEEEEEDTAGLLEDLARSAEAKMRESESLRAVTIERCDTTIAAAAAQMAERFATGGRLFTFGNGGSSTDADGAAALFRQPHTGKQLPATSLVEDTAVLTALANDVGYDLVFARQLIAHAGTSDIALGFSTSGDSRNVIHAFEEAHRHGLLTVGLSGYEGGEMASHSGVDHCLVVGSQSVHRIQETQNALVFALWEAVQRHLPERVEAVT